MTIFEFADIIDAEIDVKRYPNQDERWTCSFRGCEVQSGGTLTSVYGNDNTPERAICSYIDKIGGQKLVFWAASQDMRREYVAPRGMTL